MNNIKNISSPPESPGQFRRALGPFAALMLVVGNVVGVGIFITPGIIANQLGRPAYVLLAWTVGGLLALAGAITCGELGTLRPLAGGDYIYLREAYGPLWAFLSGWSSFLVTFPGSIASMAMGLAMFQAPAILGTEISKTLVHLPLLGHSLEISGTQLFAIFLVLTLSLLNYRGIVWGAEFQNVVTLVAVGAFVIGGAVAIGLGRGSFGHLAQPVEAASVRSLGVPVALGVALVPVFFAYSGWNATIYVAGEVKNARSALPFSLIAGTVVPILLYLFLNVVFLYALPLSKMRDVINVGEESAKILLGSGAGRVLSVFIALAILGSLNATIMAGPRIYYAMAKDGLFLPRAAMLHPKFATPSFSILCQAVWAVILILSGTFEQLLTYATAMIVAFSALTVTTIFVLRRKYPSEPRPYAAWGYPVVPGLYVLFAVGILANLLLKGYKEPLLGILGVAAGIPVYFILRARLKN